MSLQAQHELQEQYKTLADTARTMLFTTEQLMHQLLRLEPHEVHPAYPAAYKAALLSLTTLLATAPSAQPLIEPIRALAPAPDLAPLPELTGAPQLV